MEEKAECCCKICGKPIHLYDKNYYGICQECFEENSITGEKSENTDMIICSNCYQENKQGEKLCYNCGSPLYYNDTKELEEISEDDIVFYNKDNYDNEMKFSKYIVAVDKRKKQIHFYYKQELEKIINFENIIECKIVENSSVLESGRNW